MSDESPSRNDGENKSAGCQKDVQSGGDRRPSLSADDAFDLLSGERRRSVLYCLQDVNNDIVEYADLVDRVVARADSEVDRETIRVTLHHQELPKFEDAGIIDYDARSGTIRYWGHPLLENLLAAAVTETRD